MNITVLLGGVSAFAAQEILTRAPRTEQALSEDDFRAITAAADAAGLLDNSDQGYGLWSECGRGEGIDGYTLQVADPRAVLAKAAASGLATDDGGLTLFGTRLDLHGL